MRLLFFSLSQGPALSPDFCTNCAWSFSLSNHQHIAFSKNMASFYIFYLQHNLLVSDFQKRKIASFECFHFNIHTLTFQVTGSLLLDKVCFFCSLMAQPQAALFL